GRAEPAGDPGQPRRPLRRPAHRQLGADGGGRHDRLRLRRRRRLGRSPRPRPAGCARRRARRVRERWWRRARLRGGADRLARRPHARGRRGRDRAATGVAPTRVTGPAGYRVGIDVGGTFTDLICVTPDGEVLLDKTPTTPADQSAGVMNGLGQRAGAAGLSTTDLCGRVDALVHGTTTADNTMSEMAGAPTCLPRT